MSISNFTFQINVSSSLILFKSILNKTSHSYDIAFFKYRLWGVLVSHEYFCLSLCVDCSETDIV